LDVAEKMARAQYGDKHRIKPDRLAPIPHYTVSVDRMVVDTIQKKKYKKSVKSFRVIIDGVVSTENPFRNDNLIKEINKEVLNKLFS